MVEAEAVREIRALAALGWGTKRIAREVGVARNTVRRHLRGGEAAEVQRRPAAQRFDRSLAAKLFEGPAAGNAVVAQRLLGQEHGVRVSARSVQRAVASVRRERLAAQLASVRFETAPGHQLQVDFGQKLIPIAGHLVRVHFLVAVLSTADYLTQRGAPESGSLMDFARPATSLPGNQRAHPARVFPHPPRSGTLKQKRKAGLIGRAKE